MLFKAVIPCALFHILVHPVQVFGGDACKDNREEFGFALVGHDLRTMHADNFAHCFFVCSLEETCQSVTFLWNDKECQIKKETKKSRPGDFVEHPAATYMENNFRAKKGSKSSVPGSSCEDILISGDSGEDGVYWIDPAASGDPFTVFCDMKTDQGGWTLISRFLMDDANSPQEEAVYSNSYKEFLPNYNSNNQYLLRNGFNQLQIDMGFTQIRFYCFKKERGRVLHIMTNRNASGANVVKFFTDSDTMPEACGSFTSFPNDNSTLANNCGNWGYQATNRWGHQSRRTDTRLYQTPFLWVYKHYFALISTGVSPGVLYCDDDLNELGLSLGDVWQIFVR
ncbi:uncharacterized protein LOC144649082 [Oculina patagonica]